MRDVVPSAEPRSRTTYQRSTAPSGIVWSKTLLFEFFRSELLNIIRMTSSPLYGVVPTNGLLCQSQAPRSSARVVQPKPSAWFMTRPEGVHERERRQKYTGGWR